MKFIPNEGHFSTEEEALAEIAARGWHPLVLDMPADENELHWHDFETLIYIVSGTLRVEFEDGSAMEWGAGSRIEAPSKVVHREASPAYRVVFGFSVDPAEITPPLNKPLSQLV